MKSNFKQKLMDEKKYADTSWNRLLSDGCVDKERIIKAMERCNEVDNKILKYGLRELL